MDPLLSMLRTAVVETLGELAGSLAVLSMLFLLLLAGMVVVARRGRWGRMQIQFQGRTTPVAESPLPDLFTPGAFLQQRDASHDALGAAGAWLTTLYIRLLYVAMVVATFALAFLYFKYPDDGHRDFMLFYGGVLYLVGMLGLSAQLGRARRR